MTGYLLYLALLIIYLWFVFPAKMEKKTKIIIAFGFLLMPLVLFYCIALFVGDRPPTH